MLLHLPRTLHYPITVTELLKQPNDNVERFAPLFLYSYKTLVTEDDKYGDSREVERSFPARYESPLDGVLKEWKIECEQVITDSRSAIAEIDEPCPHSMQYQGMCAICGKSMTETSYVADFPDTERAPVIMVHDNSSVTVSHQEATRVEEEAKRRLLAAKKLSLVVDLDQTIIQATVDPTVAEWQQDKDNPNHDAVKDVRAFQLIDDGPGGRGCWYYIKLRPGLEQFLETVSKLYELHIYTMGTRAYAQNIAKIVDPDQKIFGDRILSRDESGSLTEKSLKRLFPTDTKMVVIIDDRADVWQWSENLIKVTPYDFFVGIGDINSSFLPKKQETIATPKDTTTAASTLGKDSEEASTIAQQGSQSKVGGDNLAPVESVSDGLEPAANDPPVKKDLTALEQLVSMGGGSDPQLLQAQATKQDETLTAQVQDRPLLQKQKQLDAEDAAAADAANAEESGGRVEEVPNDSGKQRHNLLQDNDVELHNLRQVLTEIHRVFFAEYDRCLGRAQGGRLAELRGKPSPKKPKLDLDDLDLVPDVKQIMPVMKERVLEGCVLVFSGVVRLAVDIQLSDIGLLAKKFGADVQYNINRHTTHLVAARNGSAKVKQAARHERIMIVGLQWFLDSISQWEHVEEEPYLLSVNPEDPSQGAFSDKDEIADLSSSEEDETQTNNKGGKLSVNTDFKHAPGTVIQTASPTNVDWEALNNELAEFENSTSDDSSESDGASASESVASDMSSRRSRKRKGPPSTGSIDEEQTGEGEGDNNGSALSRRKRRALERTSSLTDVSTLKYPGAGLSTTNITELEKGSTSSHNGDNGAYEEEEEDDDDLDLESALLAEMEAQQEIEDNEAKEQEGTSEQKHEGNIDRKAESQEGQDSGGKSLHPAVE